MTAATFDIKANDKTKAAFASVNKKLKQLGTDVVKYTSIAGAAITGLSVVSARNAKETIAYARAVGVSTKELTAWGYASDTVSVSQEKLNDIFKDTSEKIADAYVNKGGEALEILDRLNLSAKDMAALSPDQQLLKIAEGLSQVGTQSEKVLILESLASDASLLIPLLDDNAKKLRELTDEAHSMGISLTDIDAAKIEMGNKAWTKMLSIIEGVGNKIAAHFSPYVAEIADRFGIAAKESNGFVDVVESGMKTAAISVAYLGDGIHGLNVVWKGVEVIFKGFAAGLYTTLDELQKHILAVVNLVPGVDIKPIETLSAVTREANAEFQKSKNVLAELVSQPMPSVAIEEFFNKVDERATVSAEKVAAVVNAQTTPVMQVDDAQFDKGADLERLLSSYGSEYVLLEDKLSKELLLLDQAYLAEEVSTEKHEQTMAAIGARYAKIREKQDRIETKQKVAAFKGMFGNLSLLMESKNKEQFETGKTAAKANTIISTYEAAQNAYKSLSGIPIVGPALGAAAAFAAIKVGQQRYSAIESTSFGGGSISGGGTGAGSIGGAPVNNSIPPPPNSDSFASDGKQASGGTTVVNLIGQDKTLTSEQVDDAFIQISDAINRGDKVLFNSDSRQALELG